MYKPLADSTLLRMPKKEIIELLRTAEHNAKVSQEWVAQQAENLKDWKPVVHGRWDDSGRYTFPGGGTAVRCTECGCALTESEYHLNNWNYCPVCGRRWTEVLTMRLIDVDDLGVGRCSKDVLPAAYCAGWNGLLGLIEKAPTVDAVIVTRCKDCKHKGWVQEPCHGKSVDYCKVWDCTLRNLETTFCSYGERKDGGAE